MLFILSPANYTIYIPETTESSNLAATSQPPAATTLPPAATTQPPVATTQPPVATTQPPVATTLPPAATTLPPDPSFQLSPLQPSADTSFIMAAEMRPLLDDGLTTCMEPFKSRSQLRLIVDTVDTGVSSSLLQIWITGDRMDCTQPSTLVYMELKTSVTVINSINSLECPFVRSSQNISLVTCIYECLSPIQCQSSARVGIQVRRLSWLSRSQQLERLCDVRAFIWT